MSIPYWKQQPPIRLAPPRPLSVIWKCGVGYLLKSQPWRVGASSAPPVQLLTPWTQELTPEPCELVFQDYAMEHVRLRCFHLIPPLDWPVNQACEDHQNHEFLDYLWALDHDFSSPFHTLISLSHIGILWGVFVGFFFHGFIHTTFGRSWQFGGGGSVLDNFINVAKPAVSDYFLRLTLPSPHHRHWFVLLRSFCAWSSQSLAVSLLAFTRTLDQRCGCDLTL